MLQHYYLLDTLVYFFFLLLCFFGSRGGGGITPSSRERHKGIIGRGDNRDLGFVDAIFEGEIRNGKFFLVDTQCSIFFSFLSIESYPQAHSRWRGRGGSSPPEIFRLEFNSATKVEVFY